MAPAATETLPPSASVEYATVPVCTSTTPLLVNVQSTRVPVPAVFRNVPALLNVAPPGPHAEANKRASLCASNVPPTRLLITAPLTPHTPLPPLQIAVPALSTRPPSRPGWASL